MSKPTTSVDLKLATARMIAARKAPYLTSAVLALQPHVVPGLGTMGVTERGVLLVDPEWVAKQAPKHLATVLVHEALHVAFRHAKRANNIPNVDRRLFNVAADLEINDGLAAEGWDMGEGILPSQHGYPDGLLAEDYYARLLREQTPPNAPAQPKAMGGWDGSGAGNPVPGEPDPSTQSAAQSPQGGGDGGAGAADPKDGDGSTQAQGAGGEAPEGLSDAEQEAVAQLTAQAVKLAGKGSAGLRRWAEGRVGEPKVRWQDKLTAVCRKIAARTRGYGRVSYAHRDRKQAGIGHGPGKPIIPGHYKPTPRVMVAIDISGSMTDDVIAHALGEVRAIFTAAGAPVDFVACDDRVHVATRLRDWRDVKRNLKGGGGTDFRPIFDAVEAAKASDRPEVVVVLTDGYGPAPTAAPKGLQTIWLLTPDGRPPCAWGDTVQLGKDS